MRPTPWELDADAIGRSLKIEADRVVSLAHRRERWLSAQDEAPPPDDQKFSMMVPGWQSRIYYAYTVDVRPHVRGAIVRRAHEPPATAEPGLYEVWRHLSIQLSVPERLTAADVKINEATLLRLYEPQVQAFFPLADRVRVQWQPTDPIPVQRPGRNAAGRRAHVVTFRTVLTGHFLAPWGSDREDNHLMTAQELGGTWN